MSKVKYRWQEVVKEDKVGTVSFSQGDIYTGEPDLEELKFSRYPKGGLPITEEDWEDLQRGKKVFKTKTYTKEFEIMKIEENDSTK